MKRLRCPRCKSTVLRVMQRHVSYSAFNGYRARWSAKSGVRCFGPDKRSSDGLCGHYWRTASPLADQIQDISPEDPILGPDA